MEVPRGKTQKEKVRKAHVSHILIKVTTSQETRDKIFNELQDLLVLADKQGLDSAGKEMGIAVKKTIPFEKKSNIQYIGYSQEAEDFAFNKKVGAISDIMENPSSYYIISVAEKIPAGIAKLEDVRSTVRGDVRNELLSKICRDTAEAIYTAIDEGSNWENAAKKYNCEYQQSELISRKSYMPGVGYDPKPMGVAFSLTKVNQMSEPVSYKTGCVIMKLLEKVNPDLSTFNEKRDSIYSAVKLAKQQDLYGKWFNMLVEDSKIENYTNRANR